MPREKCTYCGKECDVFWIPVCEDCWPKFEEESAKKD